MKKFPVLLAMLAGFVMTDGAMADPIPYASPGTPLFTTYNFNSGTFSGTEYIYIIQKSPPAGFQDELSVSVGGGAFVDTGLSAKSPTLSVASFTVTPGQAIVFSIAADGQTWYSNALGVAGSPGPNTDGYSHVYSTLYSGTGLPAGIPAGTYVGFEDQQIANVLNQPGELNYDDVQFVFSTVAPVPELSTWAMFILGFAGIGFMGYRRSRNRPIAMAA